MFDKLQQEYEVSRVKKDIEKVLNRLGLSSFVTLDEIEQELRQVETAFQSLLLAGMMRRIMDRSDDDSAKLLIPAVTNWKNYLPHPDLEGLSPFEHREKYPPGPHEARLVMNMIEEYEQELSSKSKQDLDSPTLNIEKDFTEFQEKYLKRFPAEQPFSRSDGGLMTCREIIVEERRRNNFPEKDIDKVGAKLFAENTAEGMGNKLAEFDDEYYTVLQKLVAMQENPDRRSRKKVEKILEFFESNEPYHRCAPESHGFYLNYASVCVLVDDISRALSLLDRALAHNPKYELAKEMKHRIAVLQ